MDEFQFEIDETTAGKPPEGAAATAGAVAPAREGSQVLGWADRVESEVSKVFVGQTKLVRGVLTAHPG